MSTAANFAEFLESIGHNVVQIGDIYAYDKQKVAWLAFPFHTSTTYSAQLDAAVRDNKRLWLLRYCEPMDGLGMESHRIVCTDKDYALEKLSSKTRNQTRRGLEICRTEQVDPRELRTAGFELFSSTRARQNRPLDQQAKQKWELYCNSASQVSGFTAWATWVNDDLAALMIGFQMDGCFNILRQASNSEHLKSYPNNALVFTATLDTISRSDVSELSYGLSPLGKQVPTLDKFKQRMGYRAVPVRQNVVVSSRLRPLIPATSLLVKGLRKFTKNNERLAQAEAMLSVAAHQR